jgi:undecaprenyl-diphosphatase
VERRKSQAKIFSIREMSYGTAFLIGLAQAVAMIPGTSRSAATIVAGLLLGLSRMAAAEFSFFLAIPTMAAASAYSLLKSGAQFGNGEIAILATGFIVSFLVAWVVVRAFIGYLEKHDFRLFGYYRIILGLIILLFFWTK